MEIDELQGLWQTQEVPSELNEETLQGIRDFDKKVRRDRLLMRILLPLTCVYILAMAAIFGGPWYVTGVLINVAAMVMFVLRFRKVKRPGTAHSLDEDSKQALNANLATLKAYQGIAKRVTPVYGVLIILGQVIAFVEFIQDRPLGLLLLYCLLYAAGLALFFLLVYHLYMRKWRRKWQPIKERLEAQVREFS